MTRRWHPDRTIGFISALGVVMGVQSAAADPPVVRASLAYERQSGTETCPDEAALEQSVAVRLGYDPFQRGAPLRVSVVVSKPPRGFHARITTETDAGAHASRELDSEEERCDEIVQSIVLSVSLAIDPRTFAHPQAPQRAEPRPVPLVLPAAAKVEPSPLPAPAPSTPWVVDVTGAGRMGLGLVPGLLSLGPIVDLRVGKRRWALLAEVGADLPTSSMGDPEHAGAGVKGSIVHGGAGACGRLGWFSVCGRFDVGALQGSALGVAQNKPETTFYADAAIAGRLDVPLTGLLHLTVGAELALPLRQTNLSIDGSAVWTTPPVAGSFELGIGYRFGS